MPHTNLSCSLFKPNKPMGPAISRTDQSESVTAFLAQRWRSRGRTQIRGDCFTSLVPHMGRLSRFIQHWTSPI